MIEKCIFLDIDGTLRDPFYGVPESAVTAVSKAKESGHIAVVCTGRPVGLIPDDFPINMFDGIIAGGGCYIEKDGEIILDKTISIEKAIECSSQLHKLGILHRIEAADRVYMEPEMADMLDFLGEKTNNSNSEIKQLIAMKNKFAFNYTISDFLQNPVPAVKICTVSDTDNLKIIKEIFGENFNVITHFNDDNIVNTEIVQAGYNKGNGLKMFCRLFGIDLNNTIAFGDSMNDIDMFNAAAVTVCMGNGEKKLKEIADIVCDDIMKNGLYDGFVKSGLIKPNFNQEKSYLC